MNYLIIGNGIAGISGAEEIRKNDKLGRILVISKEEYLTYNRIKLSHLISKEDYTMKDLLIHDENWYKEREIEVLLNTMVTGIDTDAKEVITDSNGKIKYDKLLIANGSMPFIPPINGLDKEGVFALRTINNLDEIQRYVNKCDSISIIGGGLLGLEAAWALKQWNKKVNIIEFFPYLLPRQLDEELGIYLKEELEKQGLNFYLDSVVEKIEGDKNVRGIRLKDGRIIESDGVLISTGIRPNVTIVEGTDIQVDKGIVVDKYMKTNLEDVYAAGDIAQFNNIVFGLWSVSMNQGKVAGLNMCGNEKEYNMPKSAATLIIGKTKMFSVGNIDESEKEIKAKGENYFHKLFLNKGKITGGVLIGDIKKMLALKKAVNENRDISEMLKEDIKLEQILDNL
ncbi:MAG: FAD-dependent oxidoreductase [Clostridia bacterium]|nr:FAD-dependent oxidoreductase [Clostridia bacterium]